MAPLLSIVNDFLSVKDSVKLTFDPVVIMTYLKGETIFNRLLNTNLKTKIVLSLYFLILTFQDSSYPV